MVSPATPPPTPGSVFGPYRIDSVIAQARTGVVYLATDQRLGRQVALKVVVGTLASSAEFVERFQREAATLARLESPHVVQVFDHGTHDGLPFVASQYASGGDLGALLARLGPMPLPIAATTISQVAEALRDAHRAGVVHRNLKPGNVLLRDERLDRIHVLVCDFGVGPAEGDAMTEPASAPGAWSYLAPERIQGRPGTESSDVYALGCLLHEAVTGRPPYAGTDVEVATAHLSGPVPQLPGTDDTTRQLNQILARTLAKDPAERYGSAGEVRDDLRAFAGILSAPPTAPGASAAPTAPPAAAPRPSEAPTMAPGPRPAAPPPPPPAYQSFSVPQAPPYAAAGPTGAPGTKKNRTPLLIAGAAALALVLVLGVVIAVVAGGDDDAPAAGPSDPPSSATESTTEESEPTDPETSEPTEDAPITPDTSGAVRGDLDGDGFGDLAIPDFDGLQLFPSNGSTGFKDVEIRRNRQFNVGLVGDVDNDGTTDLVRIEGDPPQMSAIVTNLGGTTSPLPTPAGTGYVSALDVPTSLGDVDGDGTLDLVLLSRLQPPRTDDGVRAETPTQVDVAIGDGTGRFAPTTTWFTGPLPGEDTSIAVADVDGDGPSDVLFNYTDPDSAQPLALLLKSDGAAFTLEGSPLAFDNGGTARDTVRAGDFDGDGADELMSYASYGPALFVLSYDDGTWTQTPWYDNSDTVSPPSTSGWAVSDVNGDGFDDVITVGNDDNLDPIISGVFLSDGTTLTADLSWARPMPKDFFAFPLLDQRTG